LTDVSQALELFAVDGGKLKRGQILDKVFLQELFDADQLEHARSVRSVENCSGQLIAFDGKAFCTRHGFAGRPILGLAYRTPRYQAQAAGLTNLGIINLCHDGPMLDDYRIFLYGFLGVCLAVWVSVLASWYARG